ncbi:MAG: hypothetical protein ABID45_03730 [Patescibacteria group bacterium]
MNTKTLIILAVIVALLAGWLAIVMVYQTEDTQTPVPEPVTKKPSQNSDLSDQGTVTSVKVNVNNVATSVEVE